MITGKSDRVAVEIALDELEAYIGVMGQDIAEIQGEASLEKLRWAARKLSEVLARGEQGMLGELEERLIRDAILLHLQSGEKPNLKEWRKFRESAEALWSKSVDSTKAQAKAKGDVR